MDLCKGPLWGSIIKYSIPIMLTGLLQLIFNAADLVVVGLFCGSLYVAAVGATSTLVNLLVNFFIGLSVGLGSIVSQGIGEGNKEKVSKSIHTGMSFALFCGILLLVVGVLFSGTFLKWMGTPSEVLPLSSIYMKIYFCGIIGTVVYNFGAAVLRADGDTESPLKYISAGGIANLILNVILVRFAGLHVIGVALATSLTQTLAALLVVIKLMKADDACKLYLRKLAFNFRIIGNILKIGLPAAIHMTVISFSNVMIQSSVNQFGTAAVAGNSASQSLAGFVYQAMNSFSQAGMNFAGQNYGAKNYDRVKKTKNICIAYAVIFGAGLSLIMYILREQFLGIYIRDSKEAIEFGVIRMTILLLPYFLCGIQDVYSGIMRGLGFSVVPMTNALIGMCVFRIIWLLFVFTIPGLHTLQIVYLSYPISWILTSLLQFISFEIYKRKYLTEVA